MQKENYVRPQLNEARKRSRTEASVVDFVVPETLKGIGIGKKYSLQTYGCQGNEADSEKVRGLLEDLGYVKTEDEETADLIVFNTCAIRANAENKVFGELGRVKKYKLSHPGLVIAVGGCMPQEEVVVEKILKTYHQVDIVFGTHNLHRLPEYLGQVLSDRKKVVEVMSDEGQIVESLPTVRESGHKAWVNIMFGCDEFCTYCIVPYARGKERSRTPEHILSEVKDLIARGYQEVTLLGQNVNSYGLDFTGRSYHFADLLHDLSALPIPRIRFTTSHPKDFGDDLIAVLAQGGNLMPFIHLPVQSGSDKILKAMNRKYNREQYLKLVGRIRTAIPGVSLTTDIIVGFPGETAEDFLETLDLIEKCGFEGAYTFVFSPRSGTPAATLPDATPMAEKKERLWRLNEEINKGFAKGNQRFVGKTLKVLVDGKSKNRDSVLSGYTEHNKLVNFPGDERLIGHIVDVTILGAKTWSLDGELAHAEK
jgi:tRNA-2-methylthio-N6-dimethylallyladenosine synthase